MIWLATALAGGMGVYGELLPGAAWSDAAGPLVRGGVARTNFGIFWGPYRSTLQYGRYHRLGVQWGTTRPGPQVRGPLAFTLFSFGLEYGRGIDLLKVGVFWKLSANAAFFVDDSDPDDVLVDVGGVARVTGGAVYWLTRYLGVEATVGGGPAVRGLRGVSFSTGFGIGLIARAGVLTNQKKLRRRWGPSWKDEQGWIEAAPVDALPEVSGDEPEAISSAR